MTVRDARDAYLAENGFSLQGYDDPWTEASFFRISFRVPNTARHREGIMLHDLHHVATGFGTDLVGEGEISAWEVRRGLNGVGLYVASIILLGMTMGLLLSPRRALEAWGASRRGGSLFGTTRSHEELLDMTVGELRELLGVPASGVVVRPRGLHPRAPTVT